MARYGILGRNPFMKRLLIFGIAFETVSFLGCYGYFVRMNQDRELRLWMFKEYPHILDKYYMVHEMSSNNIREKDMEIWKATGKVL